MRRLVAVMLVGLATMAGATAGADVQTRARFRLSSPAFANGGTIPEGFTCIGASASPPLRWRGVPKKAKDLALIVEDPDARIGTFVHWVAWGLDPHAGRLPEETVPAGVSEGNSGAGTPGYRGPCPPPGDDPHHYVFTLYALDEKLTLAPGATADELRAAIGDTVIAKAKLVGRYGR